MAPQIPVSGWGDLPDDVLMRILNKVENPFAACAAACVSRHWRHTENNRHIANASILISVPRARDVCSQLQWLRSHANVKSLIISATGSWQIHSPHTSLVDHAHIAAQLPSAVPMACEALSIGEFVAQKLADDPSPLLHLPQLKTLLLHCRKDFVQRSIRMVQESAAGLAALTELVIESTSGTSVKGLMAVENFNELLKAVGHLPELRALSARSFDCSNFEGLLESAPQLRELRLRDCVITSQDYRVLDALMTRLEVLDFQGTMLADWWSHDFSEGTNLRVLNLSSVGCVRMMPSPILLPPKLVELDLTGCFFEGVDPVLPQSVRQLTLSDSFSDITPAYLQALPLLNVAFVEDRQMPFTYCQVDAASNSHLIHKLLQLGPGLTRLELLPRTMSDWETISSFTRLRSLASVCGQSCGSKLHSDLSKLTKLTELTKLQLAFFQDVDSDLSFLTQLKELALGGIRKAVFTGQLPSSLTLLTLDCALTRYHKIGGYNAKAAQAIIKAQSNMLQPLEQLRSLVWVENCTGSGTALPWPRMPPNLEELELTPGSGSNWEVLLPMHSLRRLTVREDARGSLSLRTTLTQMPRLHTVIYYGDRTGEGYHERTALRGTAWLQRVCPSTW